MLKSCHELYHNFKKSEYNVKGKERSGRQKLEYHSTKPKKNLYLY